MCPRHTARQTTRDGSAHAAHPPCPADDLNQLVTSVPTGVHELHREAEDADLRTLAPNFARISVASVSVKNASTSPVDVRNAAGGAFKVKLSVTARRLILYAASVCRRRSPDCTVPIRSSDRRLSAVALTSL